MTTEQTLLTQAGILTRPQLMVALKVTSETLIRWEEEHDFPSRTIGRTTLYDVEAIRKWIGKRS